MSQDEPKPSLEKTLSLLMPSLAPVSLPAAPSPRAAPTSSGMARLQQGSRLGRGGMGEVVTAHDPVLGRDVAVKNMLRARDSAFARRFTTEARVTAQLDHPNIVPVYDAELGAPDELAYSMKLVSGATLADVLDAASAARSHGEVLPEALGLEPLLDHFAKICDAVAHAHERGVVHRDLKPENVMIGAHGELYVMDWGLARIVGDSDVQGTDDDHGTLPGYAIGTTSYMAPEQAQGLPIGPPCDQFALGLILYEMVCGQPARPRGGDIEASLLRAASGERRPIADVGGGRVRRELAAIVAKATQPRPSARYASVAALADDLRRCRANLPVRAAPDTFLQRLQRWLSAHREATLRLVMLMLVLLMAAASAFLLLAVSGAGVYASWAEAREERVTRVVTQVGSRAAELDQALAAIQAQVEAVSAAGQTLMLHAKPHDVGGVLAPSVFEGEAKPEDTAWSTSYNRPISTTWPDVVIAPDVDRAIAVDQARRLVPIRHAMRRAHLVTRQNLDGLGPVDAERSWREDPGPLRWAIVGTPEGLYLEMPGAAWDATGFDGRLRPWYTLATSTEPRWSDPYPESSTGTLLVACSMQIPGAEGQVLGVDAHRLQHQGAAGAGDGLVLVGRAPSRAGLPAGLAPRPTGSPREHARRRVFHHDADGLDLPRRVAARLCGVVHRLRPGPGAEASVLSLRAVRKGSTAWQKASGASTWAK